VQRVVLRGRGRGGRTDVPPQRHGTTISENSGAASMPNATTDWLEEIPTATTSANMQRDIASRKTSPP